MRRWPDRSPPKLLRKYATQTCVDEQRSTHAPERGWFGGGGHIPSSLVNSYQYACKHDASLICNRMLNPLFPSPSFSLPTEAPAASGDCRALSAALHLHGGLGGGQPAETGGRLS